MRYTVFPKGYAPLKMIELGFGTDTKTNSFGPGMRNQYIVHYVTAGKGYFNGRPVKKGQGFLITPQTFEHYYPDREEPWEYVWGIFEGDGMEEVFQGYAIDPETKIFSFSDIQAAEMLSRKVMKNNRCIFSASVLWEWFLTLYNTHQPMGDNVSLKDYLNFAVEYIETNIYQKISVGMLTKLLGISQPYLYRLFYSQFSLSPKEYISSRKLFHAKKLLQGTNLSITEIARSVGFDDVLSFSKFFSKKENQSPSQYRKSCSLKSQKDKFE